MGLLLVKGQLLFPSFMIKDDQHRRRVGRRVEQVGDQDMLLAVADPGLGHVAVVTAVNADGSVAVDEYNRNYDGNPGHHPVEGVPGVFRPGAGLLLFLRVAGGGPLVRVRLEYRS